MTTARKHTKFQKCERHAPWLSGDSCRIWPGTDIFEPSVCKSEMTLDWTTPEEMQWALLWS